MTTGAEPSAAWDDAADVLEAALVATRDVLEDPARTRPEPPQFPDFVLEGSPGPATHARVEDLLAEVDRLAISVEARKAEIRAELNRLSALRQAGRGYLATTAHCG